MHIYVDKATITLEQHEINMLRSTLEMNLDDAVKRHYYRFDLETFLKGEADKLMLYQRLCGMLGYETLYVGMVNNWEKIIEKQDEIIPAAP